MEAPLLKGSTRNVVGVDPSPKGWEIESFSLVRRRISNVQYFVNDFKMHSES